MITCGWATEGWIIGSCSYAVPTGSRFTRVYSTHTEKPKARPGFISAQIESGSKVTSSISATINATATVVSASHLTTTISAHSVPSSQLADSVTQIHLQSTLKRQREEEALIQMLLAV